MGERVIIHEESAPKFAPHVRFRFNKQREQWVVLAPERLLVPDETSVEILKLLDGKATIAAIADELAQRYNAPREVIGRDVTALLQGLADKGFIAT
jgi:pyrroloquinoline quinone biosynthesis protein D